MPTVTRVWLVLTFASSSAWRSDVLYCDHVCEAFLKGSGESTGSKIDAAPLDVVFKGVSPMLELGVFNGLV